MSHNSVYIVLGMHKSGTTLIAKTLHYSGINMGAFDEEVSYDKGNQFEREEPLFINNLILQSEGLQSLSISPNKKKIDQSSSILSLVKELNSQYAMWGFKDPRTCLTYDHWKPFLPVHKIIVVYRKPQSVAYHYCRKGFRDYIRALNRYMQYNSRIYKIGKEKKALFVSYDKLLNSKKEYMRLSKFVGFDLSDVVDPRLNRSKEKSMLKFWICNAALFIVYQQSPIRVYRRLNAVREQQILDYAN